jgi:hypothetical protein
MDQVPFPERSSGYNDVAQMLSVGSVSSLSMIFMREGLLIGVLLDAAIDYKP